MTTLGLKLREHQKYGIELMLRHHESGHGCILADEMGLGKTCQSVVVLSYLVSQMHQRPHLILCPLSIIDHWEMEIKRFGLGNLKLIIYLGDKERRLDLRAKLNQNSDWDLMLTNYEIFLKDEKYFRFRWKSAIIDEAHRLKNSNSLLYHTIRNQSIDWLLLLTGTPLQNTMKELYALLSLLDRDKFPINDGNTFVTKYSATPEELRDTVLPSYLIRRTKTEIRQKLPERSQIVLYHGLAARQKQLYLAILRRNHACFSDSTKGSRQSLNNVLVQLRKCVNHPYLFYGEEPEPFEEGVHLVESSGKFAILDILLVHLHSNGHKVLLFSQMTRVLDIVQDYLVFRGYAYERLDGSVRSEERFAAVRNFNEKTSDSFVFLLSTKAGGVGLTLTGADTVLFLDSDFNPHNDIQAAARAHRIGQNRPVRIIHLIAKHTVEEVIQARAFGKLQLANTIIGSDPGNESDEKMSTTELITLITAGLGKLTADYAADNQTRTSTDLDAILGRTDQFGHWTTIEDSESKSSFGPDINADTSIYYFEGKDYKICQDDRIALDSLLSQRNGDEAEKKPRKVVTDEGRDALMKIRNKVVLNRLEEREKRKERRKMDKWHIHGYISRNLPDQKNDSNDDSESNVDPIFLMGDVCCPQLPTKNVLQNTLILHCVDDSGIWGQGGVFTALSSLSSLVPNHYELAGRMGDLTLGDSHKIDLEDGQNSRGKTAVVLLVAQQRKRRNAIDTNALNRCLLRLAAHFTRACPLATSVHLPRIGYGIPNVHWYCIERLVRKHLSRRGISCYVYYYTRKRRQSQSD